MDYGNNYDSYIGDDESTVIYQSEPDQTVVVEKENILNNQKGNLLLFDEVISTNKGTYVIKKKVGEGSQGQVYRVVDKNNKLYILKISKQRIKNGQAIPIKYSNEPLITETKNLKKLESVPDISKFVDEGYLIDENKQPQNYFFISEFINGQDLGEFSSLYNCELSVDSLEFLGAKLTMILQSIHDNGIVHRDIKPENIMIDSEYETPVIIDFGLASSYKYNYSLGDQKNLAGTPLYFPVFNNNPSFPYPRDDLESLIYTLIKISSRDCKLPWSEGVDKFIMKKLLDMGVKEIESIKNFTLYKRLFIEQGICNQNNSFICDILDEIKRNPVYDRPKYQKIIAMFLDKPRKPDLTDFIRIGINNVMKTYSIISVKSQDLSYVDYSVINIDNRESEHIIVYDFDYDIDYDLENIIEDFDQSRIINQGQFNFMRETFNYVIYK